MKKFLYSNTLTIILSLTILLVIVFIPPLLGNYHSFDFFNIKDAGQIGDALSGLSSPFINGFAAILVFIAFNEQVKANRLFMRQEKLKIAIDQLRDFKSDNNLEIKKLYDWTLDCPCLILSNNTGVHVEYIDCYYIILTDLKLLCNIVNDEKEEIFESIKIKIKHLYLVKLKRPFDFYLKTYDEDKSNIDKFSDKVKFIKVLIENIDSTINKY